MSAPGSNGKCPRCDAMIRWASLASTGKSIAIEPVSESRLISHAADGPYRGVQNIKALVPHSERCKKADLAHSNF